MNKITSSIVAAMFVSTFAIAGGDISPVEPAAETRAVVASSMLDGFYVGLGYSPDNMKLLHKSDNDYTVKWDGYMALAGYEFSEYAAVELRHYQTRGNDSFDMPNKIKSTGLYVKGMYPVGDFTPYAFIGLAQTKITPESSPSDFTNTRTNPALGFGLSYNVTENIAVFADYMYSNIGDYQVGNDYNGWVGLDMSVATVGLTYAF